MLGELAVELGEAVGMLLTEASARRAVQVVVAADLESEALDPVGESGSTGEELVPGVEGRIRVRFPQLRPTGSCRDGPARS